MNTIFLILFLGLLYLVFKIVGQIWRTYQHVDEQTLHDFWLKKLKRNHPSEHQRVISHLGVCQRCRDLFDRVSSEGRPIEDHLISRKFDSPR